MANKPFHFKQFSIAQDRCAMKIGTDGVLLGAWVSLQHNPQSILDIGAGTGVIALQLAQRSNAETIDALEIEENAYEQCTENFENSPWADLLFCYHASVQEFAQEIQAELEIQNENNLLDEAPLKYDLIVSNPPFYSENFKTENPSRDVARFTDALPFEHLLVCAATLLSENGIFSVIIPKKEENNFITIAERYHLFPSRICRIKGSPTSEEKRSLMDFTFQKKETIIERLVIETTRHEYTDAYRALVKDFYLKM